MFRECSSLTTSPLLPATTLTNGCYAGMFIDCSNLSVVTCLATNISATDCLSSWLNLVKSSGVFIKNANMSSWTTGGNGIPYNWIVQNYIG